MSGGGALVLIPGILCDAELWRDQIEALKEEAVVSVPVPTAATIEAMADEVLHAAPPRFALAGLSMGGYVALAMARKAPQRISRLLLANTSARPDSPEQTAGRHAMIAHVEAGGFDRVVERLLGVLVHPAGMGDAPMMERIEAMLRRVGPDAFVRQQKAAAGRPDGRPALAHISVPTHVIAGDADRVIPPDHGREIARYIPDARLTVLEECGHLSPIEHPGMVTDILRRWMTG